MAGGAWPLGHGKVASQAGLDGTALKNASRRPAIHSTGTRRTNPGPAAVPLESQHNAAIPAH